jgi:hypothetical protein
MHRGSLCLAATLPTASSRVASGRLRREDGSQQPHSHAPPTTLQRIIHTQPQPTRSNLHPATQRMECRACSRFVARGSDSRLRRRRRLMGRAFRRLLVTSGGPLPIARACTGKYACEQREEEKNGRRKEQTLIRRSFRMRACHCDCAQHPPAHSTAARRPLVLALSCHRCMAHAASSCAFTYFCRTLVTNSHSMSMSKIR